MMTSITPEQVKILSFKSDGTPQYVHKSQTGHYYWDVCFCPECIKDSQQDESQVRPKKVSSGRRLKQQLQDGHKNIGLPHLRDLHQHLLQFCPVTNRPRSTCRSKDNNFRPPAIHDGMETRQPKVYNSKVVEPDGTIKKVSPTEAVLNWQSENLIAQNKKTHLELLRLSNTNSFSNRLLVEKEAKMKSLKPQLFALQVQAQTGFPMPNTIPWRFATIPKKEQPLPVVPQKEDHVLRLKKFLDQDDLLRKQKGKQKVQETKPQPYRLPTSSKMMVQKDSFRNPLTKIIQCHCTAQLPQVQLQQLDISFDEESIPEEKDWSSDVSETEEPTPPQTQMMAREEGPTITEVIEPIEVQDETMNQPDQPQEAISTSVASDGKVHIFILDDIPPSKWRDRFQELKAWLILKVQKPNAQSCQILLQFVSRFVGILQDWWMSLGEYRQLMFLQTDQSKKL
ncbi:hypothetical protein TIFTF001_035709 [Ficus carica]|uniref:Uncharacterized protein n=1 Tax=Ficus carica TaxID=3494 RepID=A0AA88E231_FICCA|nr:hypothetical protein TIFTF001_035708 [Ficus carica]GMN66647.1 hypothetical protein TIFTF001_035709 [Ficus carica]